MLQVLDFNLGTLVIGMCVIAIGLFYRRAKRREVRGKPLPQIHGLAKYLQFFKSALDNNLHGLSLKWVEEYGDLFKISVLGTNMVFVNSSGLVRKILNDPELKNKTNDRPYTFIGRYGLYGDRNVAFNSSSPIQQRRRKAFHTVLKFYGDGVGSAESIMLQILDDEINHFRSQNVVEISKDISRIVLRIVDHLFVGYKPEEAMQRVECLRNFEMSFDSLFIYGNEAFLQPFPFLRFIPGRFKRLFDEFVRSRTNLENAYLSDRDSLLHDDDGGLVGQLLRVQDKHGKEEFPDETIKSILSEATVASYLTTSSMINTVIILCIKYPELQQRLYEEIERVIGNETPCLRRHRRHMPLMDSFILETMRYNSSAPFLLYHSSNDDIEFEGYHVPKDSILIMNAWNSQRHPDSWEDPWTFKADRFLDADGCLLPADHPTRLNLIPFGTGKRSCPGESFAKSRMFLIIVTLLGNFEYFKSADCDLPSLDPRTWRPGAVVGPDFFQCNIVPRKKTDKDFWQMNANVEKEE